MLVAGLDDRIVGCGAVHVLWEDLAEIRTLAVTDEALGRGVGTAILDALVERGLRSRVRRLFCLTFETAFFERHGFEAIEAARFPRRYAELLRSMTRGVAEFLDLERVKYLPGNTRMLRASDHPPVGRETDRGRRDHGRRGKSSGWGIRGLRAQVSTSCLTSWWSLGVSNVGKTNRQEDYPRSWANSPRAMPSARRPTSTRCAGTPLTDDDRWPWFAVDPGLDGGGDR